MTASPTEDLVTWSNRLLAGEDGGDLRDDEVRVFCPLHGTPLSVETKHFTDKTTQRCGDCQVRDLDDVRVVS
jgi:hypothetical protein